MTLPRTPLADDPLTNEDVLAYRPNLSAKQLAVQSSRMLPLQVDLSAETTLGLAIIRKFQADPELVNVTGITTQEDLLDALTSIVVYTGAQEITLQSYASAGAGASRVIPINEAAPLPAVYAWKLYASGPADSLIDIHIGSP